MSDARQGPAYGVIVAAGASERMAGTDKVFAQLAGRPLIAWTLRAFQLCDDVAGVVVVASPASVERMRRLVAEWRFTKVTGVVAGGAQRQDSVLEGVNAAVGATIVAVHDAARPLVTPQMVAQGIALARETGAAVCGVPARDTVKEVEGDPPVVRATPDRKRIWLAQTPQVFERALLLEAHERASTAMTDDASLVEAIGHPVRMYVGDPLNIKVTVEEDLLIAETLIRARLSASPPAQALPDLPPPAPG